MIENASLDILMYMFQNYLDQNADVSGMATEVFDDMESKGFHPDQICDALNWFNILHQMQDHANTNADHWERPATRMFTEDESRKISAKARGFLFKMEQDGIVDNISRELIIDRLMALEDQYVGLVEIRWVTLIVLFAQKNRKQQLDILQSLVLNEDEPRIQ